MNVYGRCQNGTLSCYLTSGAGMDLTSGSGMESDDSLSSQRTTLLRFGDPVKGCDAGCTTAYAMLRCGSATRGQPAQLQVQNVMDSGSQIKRGALTCVLYGAKLAFEGRGGLREHGYFRGLSNASRRSNFTQTKAFASVFFPMIIRPQRKAVQRQQGV